MLKKRVSLSSFDRLESRLESQIFNWLKSPSKLSKKWRDEYMLWFEKQGRREWMGVIREMSEMNGVLVSLQRREHVGSYT